MKEFTADRDRQGIGTKHREALLYVRESHMLLLGYGERG